MEKFFELKYHRLEDFHWWSVSRRDIILNLVKASNFDSVIKILDIGCSSGALLYQLKENGFNNIFGIDVSSSAKKACELKGIMNVLVMDGENIVYEDASFDLIIASDVLEHIEKDQKSVHEWKRLLKPGGSLIIFVPAFNFLWSSHDIVNRHFRRYSKNYLREILNTEGFVIDKISYWNFCLFIPVFLMRTLQRFKKKENTIKRDQFNEIPWLINKSLIILIKFENFLLKYVSFPFGVSLFAVCKKQILP